MDKSLTDSRWKKRGRVSSLRARNGARPFLRQGPQVGGVCGEGGQQVQFLNT